MAKPYSVDLREKARALIDGGEKVRVVSGLLEISQGTLRNWLCLREQTQSLAPKEGYQKGHSHKITNLKAFKEFIDKNCGETLETLAQRWGTVSDTTMGRMLKKIGYTRKKRPSATKNEMKKSGQTSST
jgi:hypothetical protein